MANIHWVVAFILARKDEKDHPFEYRNLIDSFKYLNNESIKYVLLEYYDTAETCHIRCFNHKTNVLDTIDNFPCQDFYKGTAISQFLKGHVQQVDSACKYMLITWGHGAGLGFFTKRVTEETFSGLEVTPNKRRDIVSYLNKIGEFADLFAHLEANSVVHLEEKPDPENYFILKFTEADKWIYGWLKERGYIPKFEILSSDTFGKILAAGFGTKKINILLTVNCYMQTFESGLALADSVNYLVSSQTDFLFAGIYYSKLFALLNTSSGSTSVSESSIIFNIKDHYKEKYDEFEAHRTPCYSTITPGFNFNHYQVAVNNLSIYKTILMPLLDKLINHFFVNDKIDPNLLPAIKDAREYCLDLTSKATYGLIDFLLFLQLYLTYQPSDGMAQGAFKNITQLIPANLINIYRDSGIMDAPYERNGPGTTPYYKKPQLFSLFFPNSKDPSNEFIQQFLATIYKPGQPDAYVYSKTFKWGNFVRAYYATLPG